MDCFAGEIKGVDMDQMGYYQTLDSKYTRVYKADVVRDDIEVVFMRLYEDRRHIMSDALNKNWIPVDKFIIYIWKKKRWETHETYGDCERTTYHTERVGELEVRTKDKRLANWIWYLAKKRGYTFEQFSEMDKEGMFR